MNKINWKVRFKNPVFVWQVILSVLVPILAYMGLTLEDLTSWGKLGNVLLEAVSNPYVLGLVFISVYNAVNDPTVTGHADSSLARTYDKPKSNKE